LATTGLRIWALEAHRAQNRALKPGSSISAATYIRLTVRRIGPTALVHNRVALIA